VTKTGIALTILANYLIAISGLGALLARLLGWNFSVGNALLRLTVGLVNGLSAALEPNDGKALSQLCLGTGPLLWSVGLRRGGVALLPWVASLLGGLCRLNQALDDEEGLYPDR
jgi:hypothetical protein